MSVVLFRSIAFVFSVWVDGLLPPILLSLRPGAWVVLEGAPSQAQLDSLLTCHRGQLLLANGQSVTIDSSIRFIIEVLAIQ